MNKTEFLVVITITLIVLVIWGASEFIHSKNAAIPNPDAKQYLEPVDPDFDQPTLDKINTLTAATPSASTSPRPLPSPTKSASPSATPRSSRTPSPTPKASPLPSASSIFP